MLMDAHDQTMKSNNFLVIGDFCIDIFMEVDKYPDIGGDGAAKSLKRNLGGSASNTAIALAHMGSKPTLLTHVGSDDWSSQLINDLFEEGVSIDRIVQEVSEQTGLTMLIVTPDGERTMFTYRGANALLNPDEINERLFENIEMLHLSGYALLAEPQSTAVLKAIKEAHKRNIRISLDLGVDPAYKLGVKLKKILPKISLLILGPLEAMAISGFSSINESLNYLISQGVGTVALKLGKMGCVIATINEQIPLPGVDVDAIDSTGAGDAFSAGMILGLSNGWRNDVSGLLASTMGAIAVTRWGAGKSLPGRQEVIDFLESRASSEFNHLTSELIYLLNN